MAEFEPRTTTTGYGSVPRAGGAVVYDEGLRKHMLSIYNYMTSGVLLTGIVALLFYNSPFFSTLFLATQTPSGVRLSPTLLGWVVMLSPLAMLLIARFSGGIQKWSTGTLQAGFWIFATLMGLSLSYIFALFSGESIAVTFFATSASFAALSLWGYTTKKNLSGFGTFLAMGVVGLIVAMLLNGLFFHSVGMALAINLLGVLIFAGLTAYDTQRLKDDYQYLKNTDFAGKAIILGALSLYLDFINMFMFLLQFMGNRD